MYFVFFLSKIYYYVVLNLNQYLVTASPWLPEELLLYDVFLKRLDQTRD